MFKDSRGASFAVAPTITVYIEFLLLAQYACSMNVNPQELRMPDWLKMVGFVIASDMWAAFVTLTVKVGVRHAFFCLLIVDFCFSSASAFPNFAESESLSSVFHHC
ncbi:hypothetical protein ANCCAN_29023 [Ancylostoma caninum]|uniref:Piezo TM1-24 domain-containing protein n=1 Tax=Ancylostoma caninum TaxID=29170 RepID=A0A368EZP0_ANCCA|nr:hypothetical protein ANCCAN_29023 [Ancylostoma caninum]